MKISQYRFESELDSLINAAYSASTSESARSFLIRAKNKIYAYDNIPNYLVDQYISKIESAARKLKVNV